MPGNNSELGKIPEAFEGYFRNPQVHFPEPPRDSGGTIREAGWDIRYILGHEGKRSLMELYAINRRTSDRHLKIYSDGTLEVLPSVSQGYTYKPEVPGDEDRAKGEQQAKDAEVIADLKRKGLW